MGISSLKNLSISTGSKSNKFWDQQRTDIISKDLIAYLNAGNSNSYSGSGTTWYDLTANGNNFEIFGSPGYQSGTNGYFNFPGAHTVYALREYMNNFNPQKFTISFWVYFNGSTRDILLCTSRVGNRSTTTGRASEDANNESIFSKETTGYMQYWDYDSGYGFQDVKQTGSPLNSSQWYYLTFSKDVLSGKMYVNGSLTNSFTSLKDAYIFINDFCIGKDFRDHLTSTSNAETLDGRLAQFHAYSRALSDSEVAQNFSIQRSIYGI